MKIISIGDIHGRDYWKKINFSLYDKVVFVGDYLDSYYYTDNQILENFFDIMQLKKDNLEKVILLLGNHDIQYYFLDEGFGCSGYRPTMAASLKEAFKGNRDLFQMAFQIENYLWTHAGVSKGWLDWNKKEIDDFNERFECINLADTFNKMLQAKENRLLHQIGKKRGGRYPSGGITWADRIETSNNYLDNYHQIVGHTPINIITKFGDDKSSIRYIDVLDEKKIQRDFYEFELKTT